MHKSSTRRTIVQKFDTCVKVETVFMLKKVTKEKQIIIKLDCRANTLLNFSTNLIHIELQQKTLLEFEKIILKNVLKNLYIANKY